MQISQRFLLLGLLIYGFIGLYACNKDKTDPNQNNKNPNAQNQWVRCQIDGKSYDAAFPFGYFAQISNSIIITGSTGNTSEEILIIVDKDIKPGTYTEFNTLVKGEAVFMNYSPEFSEDFGDDGPADKGKLVITEHDLIANKITGTFEFDTKPSINAQTTWKITNGSFQIFY